MDYTFEDFNIDNFKSPKKKLNSGKKGRSAERELCKILAERFKKPFIRTLGSGNRWSQVSAMPQHAVDTFTADLCAPEGYLWCIESKNGYEDDLDLGNVFEKDNAILIDWFKTALKDSKSCDRKPLICWKRSRKPWVSFLLNKDLNGNISNFPRRLILDKWTCIPLNKLLELPDSFFFEAEQ